MSLRWVQQVLVRSGDTTRKYWSSRDDRKNEKQRGRQVWRGDQPIDHSVEVISMAVAVIDLEVTIQDLEEEATTGESTIFLSYPQTQLHSNLIEFSP